MLARISGTITVFWGMRRWATAALAGALATFSQAPFHIFPVLWISFPVLIWLLDGASDLDERGRTRRFRPAAAVGWWFGFGYFLAGLWWVGGAFLVEADTFGWLLPIAVPALPAGLAIVWALAIGIAGLLWTADGRRVLILAVALALGEWLRGFLFTGFPWNTLGYGLATNTLLMQASALVGIYGLTLAAVIIFAAPALLTKADSPAGGGAKSVIILAVLLFAGTAGYGAVRLYLSPSTPEMHEHVRLRIVQPAIDQAEKWLPENREKILKSYLDLSDRSASPDRLGLIGVTHLIWPESALPFFLAQSPKALAAIAKLLPPGTTLITGAVRAEAAMPGIAKRAVYNSIFLVGEDGTILNAYDKVRLVPFGEYLPFQSLLESFGFQQLARQRGGFAAGAVRKALEIPSAPPADPLICYEIIFAGAAGKGEWLLNVTNDAWFGNTPGPYQHFHQARVRAVEHGKPLVRAANTGISAIVDPYGRVISSLKLGQQGVLDGLLPKPVSAPPYGRFGDSIFFVLAALTLLWILIGRPKPRARQPD